MKAQALADHLAENPVDEEYKPLKTYFPNEELRFYCTNNMAEYETCILGLRMAMDIGVQEVLILGDSDLLVYQIQGEIGNMRFKTHTVPTVLAGSLSTVPVNRVQSQIHDQHAYYNVVEEELDGEPWFHDIKEYIRMGVYPVQATVRATPYLLVYDTEVVIPAEVEIPSVRIVAEAEIDDDEWVKTRLEQLSLIDEKRLAAVCHG
ncbi:uncharacterized protein [Nicotiana sylvestris]|uniref:uncharacterized protein n=1 Tax=Nicotiana sylvestris TaxID=4096 RepID=UPI00388C7C90